MKNIIFGNEAEVDSDFEENTGFMYNSIKSLSTRGLSDAINTNLAILSMKIGHTDITQTLEALETEIRADLDKEYTSPDKLEKLWRGQFFRKESPYNYLFHCSMFLTITAKIMLEEGETEAGWSFIAAAFKYTGGFEAEELIEFRIEKSKSRSITASKGGKASAARYEATKEKAKVLLIEKMKTNTPQNAHQAAKLIQDDLSKLEGVTLTETHITRTLRDWIATDELFEEFGLDSPCD